MYANKKRHGFTLVELLVVIAIITLLIAMTLPVLKTARDNAKTVVCSSNIKQTLDAFAVYETQYRTFPNGDDIRPLQPPPPGGYVKGQTDKASWWWFNLTGQFSGRDIKKRTALWCPSRNVKQLTPNINVLCANYGVNQAICKSVLAFNKWELLGTPLSSQQIPQTSKTMLVMDSGHALIMWLHATDTPPVVLTDKSTDSAYVPGLWINKDRVGHSVRAGLEFDAINGRHPQKSVNTGFIDGHVERLKANDFYVGKTATGYTNRTPLWLPTQEP